MASDTKTKSKAGQTFLSVPIHPELRKEMHIAALRNGLDMYIWLHRLLCRELDRGDLVASPPRTS